MESRIGKIKFNFIQRSKGVNVLLKRMIIISIVKTLKKILLLHIIRSTINCGFYLSLIESLMGYEHKNPC